jgi:S-DNA-T family DNA segregation ATPase FtsK/SpoIIIE
LARRLAPRRLAAAEAGAVGLLGLDRPWTLRGGRDLLRVPIGTGADGRAVWLDLKESARDGMGPHGLLIGATGSGKSELLRTLVLALAASHDPAVLNLVLVDFKGGATFASFDRLPHTAAVITNLRDRLALVDRMADALNGEVVRRQELLRAAGCASARDYPGALPTLLVVCDEFAELLSAKPDLIDTFVQIGRLGRSLGVHLLLASQRLEEGRLRGLETHLSYRIGLRTFSAVESRAVLGVADAYELPRSPGHGYLKAGTEPLQRFRAAYVSGPVPNDAAPEGVVPFTVEPVGGSVAEGPTLLDTVVDRLAGRGTPAHRIWLPPLDEPAELTDLVDAAPPGRLTVPVALVDRPFDQRRDPLTLDLTGSAGHLAVVGGPRSGKSGLLTTVLCGLALAHPPDRVQIYCLDFGGGTLATLARLPHVGGVATRTDRDAVRRTVADLTTRLTTRETTPDPGGPDLFLVVDGWSTLRGEYEDLETVLTDLGTRGLGYGFHLIATAARWTDFRPGLRDLFGSRLELRLGDPAESTVSRRAAASVPERSPGRGLTTDGYHFLAAVPPGTAMVNRIAATWTGPPAPPVRLLPATVAYDRIADPASIVIGVAEPDLGPVALDLATDPHFLVFGDAGSGKSAFLRTLATSIARRHRPEQARIVLVDHRRSLLGALDSEHLIGYGTSTATTTELVKSVAGYLRARLPGPDVTPTQLRDRSWWTGPDCYLLVDDYDLVASGSPNPLLPLLDYLPQARDVGLHLVLARRSGGAGRALHEPVLQRLRELATPGLVLSGDREEGPLLGTVRPGRLPPGRGWLVTRSDGARLVQLAHLPAP